VSAAPPLARDGLGVSDVLVITGTAGLSRLIEAGEALAGIPGGSHVAGMHHWDAHGTPWGLEGRPGGVGWVDLRPYLADPRTITNAAQPRTDAQRIAVAEVMLGMFGTAYGWVSGIAEDIWRDLGGDAVWAPVPVPGSPLPLSPGHVVCSSYMALAYDKTGVPGPRPADWQHTEPGDWTAWIAGNLPAWAGHGC
jgi:hypothetical protein